MSEFQELVDQIEQEAQEAGPQVVAQLRDLQARFQRESELILANKAVQDWVTHHGAVLPNDFLKLLSDLDWVVRNEEEASV